jgi:hypothetical protein
LSILKFDFSAAAESRDKKGDEVRLNEQIFSSQLLKVRACDVFFDDGENELENGVPKKMRGRAFLLTMIDDATELLVVDLMVSVFSIMILICCLLCRCQCRDLEPNAMEEGKWARPMLIFSFSEFYPLPLWAGHDSALL